LLLLEVAFFPAPEPGFYSPTTDDEIENEKREKFEERWNF
jgi:hypothetical protein